MGMRCVERHVRQQVKKKLGWTVTLGRAANITKPIKDRLPCHYCGPCERGCATKSYFNSAFTTVADALAYRQLHTRQNAMVYKVLTDKSTHKATGVLYIDRVTREAKEVHARAVVLCAQALESARILLNSMSEQYPAGLGNSSGALGHYLMDHTVGGRRRVRRVPGAREVGKPSVDGAATPRRDSTRSASATRRRAADKASAAATASRAAAARAFNW